MNIVIMSGYVATEPVVSIVNDSKVMKFRIAVRRTKETTDFFNVEVWDKPIEYLEGILRKGVKCVINGSLRANEYTDRLGNKKTWYTIRAYQIDLFIPKQEETKEEEIEEEFDEFLDV
jgi:single-strand DNA-binding protein